MSTDQKKTEEKMQRVISLLNEEFASVRAGRANPSVLDKIRVDYYGTPTPIGQMAAVSVPEARILMIQPWDPSTLKNIEKAIQIADIGLNPQNDGKVIRLTFPTLTEERRRELVKTIRKYAEEAKISIRNVRRDSIEELKGQKKKSVITEDDLKDAEKEIQDLTDKFCVEVDKAASEKEKEIMSV